MSTLNGHFFLEYQLFCQRKQTKGQIYFKKGRFKMQDRRFVSFVENNQQHTIYLDFVTLGSFNFNLKPISSYESNIKKMIVQSLCVPLSSCLSPFSLLSLSTSITALDIWIRYLMLSAFTHHLLSFLL